MSALGVLHDHVEIAVLVEDPGVQQLVLHLLLAPAAVGGHQVPVRERPLRILVLALHVRMRRRAVQVEPVLLDVLAMVALAIVQAEHPLLENRVGAVPQRQRQAQPLALVADPGDPVLTPPVSTRPRLIVGEVVPRVSAPAVVLAHRPPLPLAQIRAPRLPRNRAGARLLQPLVLGGLGACGVRCHSRTVCTSLGGRATVPTPRTPGGLPVSSPQGVASGSPITTRAQGGVRRNFRLDSPPGGDLRRPTGLDAQ